MNQALCTHYPPRATSVRENENACQGVLMQEPHLSDRGAWLM